MSLTSHSEFPAIISTATTLSFPSNQSSNTVILKTLLALHTHIKKPPQPITTQSVPQHPSTSPLLLRNKTHHITKTFTHSQSNQHFTPIIIICSPLGFITSSIPPCSGALLTTSGYYPEKQIAGEKKTPSRPSNLPLLGKQTTTTTYTLYILAKDSSRGSYGGSSSFLGSLVWGPISSSFRILLPRPSAGLWHVILDLFAWIGKVAACFSLDISPRGFSMGA
ncbi:hypothetical protein HDV62DRAFT_322273 [Trichoderma sp. SZMC 28011]